MKNKEILKTILLDIWTNYKIFAIIYPLFAFLIWLNKEELVGFPILTALALSICFGGIFFIIGYGIRQFFKIKGGVK